MYLDVFKDLGLATNEGRIYETLLQHGQLGVGALSKQSQVHRRNVYDSLQRLMQRGLVFEIRQSKENLYKAVDPHKLMNILEERRTALNKIMPGLVSLYRNTPEQQEVFIYRGIEGWKNYMRDIIRVGADFYCIGGKGAWMDERLKHFSPQFFNECKRKRIKMFHLFDNEVLSARHPIIKKVGKEYKFLPTGYSAPASVDFFGNYVNIVSNISLGGMDKDFSFTVIVNPQIAEAFRTWFKFMWDFCPKTPVK
jgi:sugar-specific transcriptional regulator TrmB